MTAFERLARRRQWLLLGAAAGFTAWQAAFLFPKARPGFATLLSLPGFALFFVSFGAMWFWAKAASDGGVGDSLEDEMTRHNRLLALAAGFWAMLSIGALLLAAAPFVPVDASQAARLVLIGGVAVPLVRFAMLERLVDDGE
jgi:hypothetical protein